MKTYDLMYTRPSNTTASCVVHNWIPKSSSSNHVWWQCTRCGSVKNFKPRVTTTKSGGDNE